MMIKDYAQHFVREARDTVRRGDRDRALTLLRQLVAAIDGAEQRAVKALQPAIDAVAQVGNALDAIAALGARGGRR